MVETGHGTEDNFTGQVMERKKNPAAKHIRTLLNGGSLSTAIYSYVCFLLYLFIYLFIHSLFNNAVTITGYLVI